MRKTILQPIIFMVLIYLSVTGSDCNKILQNQNGIPDQLVGNWKMVEQTGALQDICPDENVNYQASGTAQLTCPGSDPISRNFTIANTVLTYTQSSIEYDYEFYNDENGQPSLGLYGRNVSRNLYYLKIAAADRPSVTNPNAEFHNSSEGGK